MLVFLHRTTVARSAVVVRRLHPAACPAFEAEQYVVNTCSILGGILNLRGETRSPLLYECT
eukprot:1145112-Pelagomonas_calceolata.AAC.16